MYEVLGRISTGSLNIARKVSSLPSQQKVVVLEPHTFLVARCIIWNIHKKIFVILLLLRKIVHVELFRQLSGIAFKQ